ncbi:hypothetical protein ZWY2020_025223 [Hordeum vulgare]|nr:hypothetical protein ZWY2020_025223 [Hordeum vulgare]
MPPSAPASSTPPPRRTAGCSAPRSPTAPTPARASATARARARRLRRRAGLTWPTRPHCSPGRALRGLGRYALAADCFRAALHAGAGGGADEAREMLDQCRRLEAQARSGAVDLSDWVLAGFSGKCPDLAEFVGPVEVRQSAHGGRGVFAVKSVEAGGILMISKAVATGRGVIPDAADSDEKMVVWKDFVDKVLDAAEKCPRTASLIYSLSTGEEQKDELAVPDMALFAKSQRISVTAYRRLAHERRQGRGGSNAGVTGAGSRRRTLPQAGTCEIRERVGQRRSRHGALVVRLEDKMRKSMVKERRKAFVRVLLSAYSALFDKWQVGEKVGEEGSWEAVIAESVAGAVGDESLLRAMLRGANDGNGCGNRLEVEDKVVRIGRLPMAR